MPNTLRVLLSPVPAPLLAERNAVEGVEVALTSFGKFGSAASQSPTPAKLRFHARYISRIRKDEASAWQPFATLSGRIVLRGPGLKPVFLNDTEAGAGRSMSYEHPLDSDDAVSGPADGKPRRVLKLDFASASFEGIADAELLNEHLVLPPEPPGAFHHLELQAELEVGGGAEAERDTNAVVDVPLFVADEFPLPNQKSQAVFLDQPIEPILLADASAVTGQDPNVATDALPGPPSQIARFKEGAAVAPTIRHDHGFLDDGNGNIDASRFVAPTIGDRLALAKWRAKLRGAQLLRADLKDATDAYSHYLFGGGAPFSFSYERFIATDKSGKSVLKSAVKDTVDAAVALHETKVPFTPDAPRTDEFSIVSTAVSVGSDSRYPYPATENWQKAIGGHAVWLSANVKVVTNPQTGRKFDIELTLHAEDMYNFNPGDADIATGTPDSENGRFQLTRQGHEFLNRSRMTRRISLDLAPIGDSVDPDDIVVSGPPIVAAPAPGATAPSPPPPAP